MTNNYCGWTGDAFTLIVGPDEVNLTVPRGVLEKIPYFQHALRDTNQFRENETKTFNFPDDDPSVISNVLFYAHTEQVPEVGGGSEPLNWSEEEDHCIEYLKAFIVADRWKLETIANSLIDGTIRYCYLNFMDYSRMIHVLRRADLQHSALYGCLKEQIAKEILEQCHGSSVTGSSQSAKEWCDRLEVEDLREIFVATQELDDSREPMAEAAENLCSLHRHDLTEKCSSKAQKEGEEI